VLASIYLQAVIAASMEDVELFLAPLTARSKIREVLRGLVATRQVHTISMGHAPHFYVAGTLPEFSVTPSIYASSAMASSYYFDSNRFEDETPFVPERRPEPEPIELVAKPELLEENSERTAAKQEPIASGKPAAARPHFSRSGSHTRDRKRAGSSPAPRPARRPAREARPASSRSGATRVSSAARWAKPTNGNGTHKSAVNANHGAKPHNGHAANGTSTSGRTANGKPGSTSIAQRNGHSSNGKVLSKPGVSARGTGSRPESRSDARSRKPALAAGAKAGNSKRYGFTAPAKPGTKKRG
jgi:hypothetical protein